MKKIKSLLLLCLFLIVSTISYAQMYMETFAVSIGEWSEVKDDWIWEPMMYQEITFVLDGNTINVNDQAESSYYTYEQLTNELDLTVWRAFDEQNRGCLIGMSKSKSEPMTIYIMYDNTIYKYYFKE
jgi:hypothetical protein